MTASSLIGIDFKTGEKVEGDGVALESAVCIHCPVHIARYEKYGTIAVMHTHQPYVTALGKTVKVLSKSESCRRERAFSLTLVVPISVIPLSEHVPLSRPSPRLVLFPCSQLMNKYRLDNSV